MSDSATPRRFPPWLKKRLRAGPEGRKVREILAELSLDTVCRSALCPNMGECFQKGTATFLIMGPMCTRSCAFCAVGGGDPRALQADEPERVAEAVRRLGLKHVVITSVTRDDLADGGAAHFAATVRAVKSAVDASVEVLTSDFAGSHESVKTVIDAGPDVFNHNVETVPRLYGAVRPQADYRRSLDVLKTARRSGGKIITKSGLMVGLGETMQEVEIVFEDLLSVGCSIVTVGQYLSPSKDHLPVARFVEPAEFERLQNIAEDMGFAAAHCAPFARSSHMAAEVLAGVR